MSIARRLLLTQLAFLFAFQCATRAADQNPAMDMKRPIAILPFHERGGEVKGLGAQVSDLIFANLVKEPTLWLVDREDFSRSLAEQELSLSGMIEPSEATKIGRMTGARILVTGSLFQADGSLYFVAKVLGAETTRVLGTSVKGSSNDRVDALASQLADEISKVIKEHGAELAPTEPEAQDRIKSLKDKLGVPAFRAFPFRFESNTWRRSTSRSSGDE